MFPILLLIAITGADADTPRWPAFQGVGATAIEAGTLPLEWSPQKNIAWKAKISGYGQSSPVIWGDRVFITSVEGPMKDRYHVAAYSLADGNRQWQHTIDSTSPVKSSNYVSRAAPTPAADADALYVFFESGDLLALTHDGKELWKRSLAEDYGKFDSGHGVAASPLVTDDFVVILADHDGPAYLLAANKSDGKTAWKTERKSRIGWSSPKLIETKQGAQIVCSSNGSVDGYAPATGEQLWTIGQLGGNTTQSPMAFGDQCFLVGAAIGRDGEASADAKRTNMAVQLTVEDGKPVAKQLWLAEKATSSFGSPMAHAGVAYWVNRSGVVFGYETVSGKLLFTERLPESCWATPLGIGERVYFFGKDGTTTVVKAGAEFEVLAENLLWENDDSSQEDGQDGSPAAAFAQPVQYGVAAVNGSLLIRSGSDLYCVRR